MTSVFVMGGQVYSGGGPVTVTVFPSEAGITSQLYLYEPAVPPIWIASNRETGKVVELPAFPAGTELVFGIDAGNIWRMGPGTRNSDGNPHANVEFQEGGYVIVGFEDLPGAGGDYNDNVFGFAGLSGGRWVVGRIGS